MDLRKTLVYLQIALQIFPPSSLIYLGATQQSYAQERVATVNTEAEEDTDQTLARTAIQAGTILGSDNGGSVTSAITSAATGAASAEVQEWLNQFGTARVNLSLDENFSLQDSDLDVLVPLYDDKKSNLLFTQLGGRRNDDRNIVNAGFGYRYFSDSWMWGTNVFYDRQVSGNQHQRLGAGTEFGWDYLKLSANGYFRLSDWKESKSYEDYDERVANGFDIRAKGYLPAWPQLGASVVYEQYYGDSVGLFGDDEDDRQKNPHAVTLGLDYTPVPLLTFGVNQKFGKGGEDDFQVNMAMTWTPGVPLRDQLDPSAVAARRTLMGGRQELVDRNNNIVLEYRKQDIISLSLPPEITGDEKTDHPVTAKVTAKHGLDHIEWQGDSFFNHGGKVESTSSPYQFTVTLPLWQDNNQNSYTLTGTAWDKNGNASNPSHMQINVNGIDVASLQSTTTASPVTIPADGVSTSQVTVTLYRDDGLNATGLASRLTATMAVSNVTPDTSGAEPKTHTLSSFTEQSPGVYVSTFTCGTTPDTVIVQPAIDGTIKLATAKIIEEPVTNIATLSSLEESATSALADGVSTITLTAHVVDQNGNTLKDKTIRWSADKTQAQLSATESTTDEKGQAQITVTSNDVIDTIVTASLDQGNSLSTPTLSFTADTADAQVVAIKANKTQVVANNKDSVKVSALVTDDNQHPLEGITVDWDIDKTDNTALGQRTSVTNDAGIATTELKSAKVGTITVAASVNNGAEKQTGEINFVADQESERVTDITLSKTQATADGVDSITYTATVTDTLGNPVSGATVNWSADNSDARLNPAQTTSDENGKSSITVTSQKAGDVIVTAQTSDTTPRQADKASFVADKATAHLLTVVSDKASALANGNDVITLTATVADAYNNLLEGVDVNWNVSPAGGVLSTNSGTTGADGVARVTLTSTTVDSYTVTATANNDSKDVKGLQFTVDVNSEHLEKIVATPSTEAIADGQSAITLTTHLIDNAGHPVSGETVNWSADNASATLSDAQSVTDEQGQVQITVTSADVIATVITAKHGGNDSQQSDTLHFTADQASAKVVTIVSDKYSVVANKMDKAIVTATVLDSHQHPLANVDVNWAIDKATDGSNLGQRSSKTNDQGQATTELSSDRVGSAKVSASYNGGEAKQTNEITFIADQTTEAVTSITLSKTQAIANGIDSITYEATLTDAQGHPVPNATVTWSADKRDAQLSTTQTTSDENGKSSITVISLKAGDVIITAQTSDVTPYDADKATFIADKTTAKVLEVDSDRDSGLANGNDALKITAKVVDANDNLVSDMDVSWSKDLSTGTLSTDSSKTNASGLAEVSLRSMEVATYKVTAETNGTSGSKSGLSFIGDNATALVVSIDADKKVDIIADKDTVTLTALVEDENHHPLSGITVNWSSSDEANSTFKPGASSVTNEQGIATITFSTLKAGTVNVTASVNSSSQVQPLEVIANEATAKVTLTSDKKQGIADGIDKVIWTATMLDKNGNPVIGKNMTWTTNNADVTLDTTTNVTDDQGQATSGGSSLKSGKVIVTARADVTPSRYDDSDQVTFVGDAKTAHLVTLTHDIDHAAAGVDTVHYTVEVRDGNDNLVPDASVAWTTDINRLSASSTTTDKNGIATVGLSGTKFGFATVTATINDSTLTDNKVEFIASVSGDWIIEDASALDEYNGPYVSSFPKLGYVATGDTVGPTDIFYSNGVPGNTLITIPMTNVETNAVITVTISARNSTPCAGMQFNDASTCELAESRANFQFRTYDGDNAHIPSGVYTGKITYDGKDWDSSWALSYTTTVKLTKP
ncbi:Ig-like domain-containing protein [Shigella flexneri]